MYIYIYIYIYIYQTTLCISPLVIKEKSNNIYKMKFFLLLPVSIHNIYIYIMLMKPKISILFSSSGYTKRFHSKGQYLF